MSILTKTLLLTVLTLRISSAYSVLTHEAIIDSAWGKDIRPLLAARFPDATPEEIDKAHGYTYGGCIIQDMGYYPFASRLFSDLVHYVRSGDFVLNLLRESQDLNEYAFALGALAHYAADTNGHHIATNVAVPILYPKLREQFGPTVTYWDNPKAHARTEFAFDVLQVARGRYAPGAYRDFVGFDVSKPLLERAFHDTYGIELPDIFHSLDLALGTYRYAVSTVLPTLTSAAWKLKGEMIVKEIPGATRKKFLYSLSRASYEKQWGKSYRRPGMGAQVLAFFIRIIPKVGPLSALQFRTPTPDVEKLFMESFNATTDSYNKLLAQSRAASFALINDNLDSGDPTVLGAYQGADEAYAALLDKLSDHKFAQLTPEIRQDLLDFYKDLRAPAPSVPKKDLARLNKTIRQVEELRALPAPAQLAAR